MNKNSTKENNNEKVKLYNDWLKQTYSTAQVVELEEYVSSYTKYVDVNNDGVFEGVKEK